MPPQPESEDLKQPLGEGRRADPEDQAPPLTKLAVELGPLLVFFAANAAYGIYAGTALFMAATVVALTYAAFRYRKIPAMPVVSAVIVMIFGGLTLYLQDDTFIKLKPTIVYVVFAVVLGAGLIFKKRLLQALFGQAFELSEEGWRLLTYRWIVFFLVMAVVNEVVWRNFSTDTWVAFKAFGFLPLTIVFALLQMPLMQRHSLENEDRDAMSR